MVPNQGHPIKVVARRTGLTPHVIRAWEKRYGAVSPARTPTHRRLYSEEDIERLILLRRAILTGRSIGQIAHLPTENLRTLVTTDEAAALHLPQASGSKGGDSSPQSHLEACLAEVQRLNAQGLEKMLTRATVALSRPLLLEQVIIPLMEKIGDMWREGSLRIVHEHLASAIVRTFLGSMNGAFESPASGPNFIATTPAGQLHEFGALIAAATAASEGWRVTYLGPNLPAEEIAGAAQQLQAKVVALSLVYPADDLHLTHELKKLRHCLPEDVRVIVGGRAAHSYSDILEAIGAIRPPTITSFRTELESLRSR